MTKKNTNSSVSLPTWTVSLVLLAVLYLMYAPSFTLDYLMNDELRHIGIDTDPLKEFLKGFFISGRPLFGIYKSLVYHFVDYDPIKIQFVRFVNFTSLAAIGLLLFRFLRLQSKSIYLSFFTILFLFSQLSFQGIIGYSVQVISNSQPSMWLSLCAFDLHFYFFPKRQLRKWIAYAIVFIIFMAAMQSTQTYAYFAMVPLSFLVLTEDKQRNQQILIFFALALASFILCTILYKAGLEILEMVNLEGYKLGEQGLTALTSSPLKVLFTAVNPKTYWSAFKVWTYPYPFHYTLPLGSFKPIMAVIVMIAWFSLIVSAIVTEFSRTERDEKRHILLKWLWALLCLSFGAVFIIADSPLQVSDHRPHMTITFIGVCIFTGAYAFQVLSSSYRIFNTTVAKSVGILIVVLTAFGAQSSLLKGIVNIRENQINFIRIELSSKSPSAYRKIVVVLPRSTTRATCISEPCDLWFGRVTHWGKFHTTSKGRYEYALATLGISPKSKEIIFVHDYPKQVAEDELIIDWKKYVKAYKRHLNYLRKDEVKN